MRKERRNIGSSSIYDLWYLVKALARMVLSRQIGLEKKLKRLEGIIMANQEDLLAAVEASKVELLASVEAEKVETLSKLDLLAQRIAELEAIIAAGGDTQPAIDALKAATAEVKAGVEGITV